MAFTRPKAAQIDFDITNITDPLIRLNSGETGSADKDVGIVIERGDDTNVALIYDESADQFVLINTTETGTTSGNVTISSYADLQVATINTATLEIGGTAVTSTAAELNILDGVTATAAELNILDGVTATATELNYVDGVTSAIQTQLDAKLALAGGTMTGAIAMGTNKITGMGDPTANQDAATKAYVDTQTSSIVTTTDIAGDTGTDTVTLGSDTLTFSGTANEITTAVTDNTVTISLPDNVTVGQDLIVTGNLTVNGTTTTISTTNSVVSDSLIELNTGAASNANDLGIVMERGSTGDNAIIAWDESADAFVMGTTTATGASTGNLTITAGALSIGSLTLGGTAITSTAAELNILDGVTATAAELNALDGITATVTELNYTDGVTSNIQTQLDAKAPSATPTFTGNVTFDTNTLFVDASNNRIGVGTTSPAYQVEIENTAANALLVLQRTDGASCFIEGQATRSAFGSVGATPLALAYNSLAVITIGAGGAITVNPDGGSPFTLPTADGSANQFLQTNGAGTVTFASATVSDISDLTATAAELNILDGVTSTAAELNILDGVTSTAAELNVLDGITATTAELNYTDGVTSNIQTQLDAKASLTGSETLTNKTLTSPQVNTNIDLLAQADLRFYDADNSNYVGFQSPATATGNILWTLPGSDGTDGQVLSTNGGGTLSWEDPGSGGGSGSSYPNSTFTTVPGTDGNFDMSYNVAQTTQETPFEAGGTDAFGVNLGSVFSLMDPIGSLESIDYGTGEAYVGA